jgi:hypothetical protein
LISLNRFADDSDEDKTVNEIQQKLNKLLEKDIIAKKQSFSGLELNSERI